MTDATIEETPEQLAAGELAEAEAFARVIAARARKALTDAPDVAMHVRALATNGKVERGETLPEWSAPMRITAADDLDGFYAELVDWVTYWTRWLDFTAHDATRAAWWSYAGVRGFRVQGFRAATTPVAATMLVRVQTMWLLDHHEQIKLHPEAGEYFQDVARFVWAIAAKYPTKEPRPRNVSLRPCSLCGEYAVGAEWSSEDPLDVEISCEHCGYLYSSASPTQILKWLSVDEPTVALSEHCTAGAHRRCDSVHCECNCHSATALKEAA